MCERFVQRELFEQETCWQPISVDRESSNFGRDRENLYVTSSNPGKMKSNIDSLPRTRYDARSSSLTVDGPISRGPAAVSHSFIDLIFFYLNEHAPQALRRSEIPVDRVYSIFHRALLWPLAK